MSEFSLDIKISSLLHRRILDAMNARYSFSAQKMSNQHDKWRRDEDLFIAFTPEKDVDAVRRLKRENDGKPQYTTIILPYTYAQLMSAHSYWTTVFLSRDPVFQFSGRHGESEQQTQALEALIAYQVQVGEMMVPFYFWLLDTGKFGLGVMGDYWTEEQHSVSRYIEVPDMLMGVDMGTTSKQFVSETRRGYYGNKLFNIRPYDYYPDTRVPFHAVQRGEFVAYHSEVGWHELLRQEASGEFVNVQDLRRLRMGGAWTGREPGSPNIEMPNDDFNAAMLSPGDLNETGPYGLITMEVDLVPAQWGLSKVNTSEKWVFTGGVQGGGGAAPNKAAGNISVVCQARPLGCEHNKFRINTLAMEPEAYALTSRSLPQIIEPLQNTMDWLVNSHMYAVRKTLNNQFLVDPSRIVMADFIDPQNGGAIRARPSAYGTDIQQAIKQLPVVDLTRQHMMDVGVFNEFAQRASGVNDQLMGQVQSGGRKTAQEVRTSSSFGINRQKTISEFYSHMGFSPLSQRLVQNSQQYYDTPMKLRLVGDLAMESGPKFFEVTPQDIAGFFDFVTVDGTMPIDRYQMANLWQQMFGQISKIPQVVGQYDLGRMFSWVAQLAGLRNINRFKIQVAPPGVDPRMMGGPGGNVVPISQAQDMTRTIEPGQVPGMGTSG